MGKYTVVIEEICTNEFELEAPTEAEAIEIAKQKYRHCEFVLEPGALQSAKVAIARTDGSLSKWLELF